MFALFAFCLQLQNAVKLLDSGAVRATRFLWRYPIARIFLLFYLVRRSLIYSISFALLVNLWYIKMTSFMNLQVFVHLFLMYLLHRLQVCLVLLHWISHHSHGTQLLVVPKSHPLVGASRGPGSCWNDQQRFQTITDSMRSNKWGFKRLLSEKCGRKRHNYGLNRRL